MLQAVNQSSDALAELQTTLTMLEIQDRSTPLALKRNIAFGRRIRGTIGVRD